MYNYQYHVRNVRLKGLLSMKVSVNAYAKINLFLDVHSRKENGYHNIVSLMHTVSLCDKISVELSPSDSKNIAVTCTNESLPCNKDNLVYKAAELYPITGNIKIHITKNIPVSAGLAGGSADAAATLKALNSISQIPMDIDELCALGASLGADIPFCIKGGACLVEEIGDILTPVSPMPCFPMVIARKGEGMSTPAAYGALDRKYNNFDGYSVHCNCLDLLKKQDVISAKEFCKGLYNIFESVVEEQRPCVSEIKAIMNSYNASGVLMSGSGTAVFGIFENKVDAQRAVDALKNSGATAHLCFPQA